MTAVGGSWWAVALRGIAAIIFGLAALIWPGVTLVVLIVLFGVYVLFDGIFAIVAAVRSPERDNRFWALLAEGVFGILIGLAVFFWPGLTGLILLFLIAFWAIVTGVLEIGAAVRLRDQIRNEWLLAAAGVVSIIFGFFLLAFPGAGALAVITIIGIYALVFGALLVVYGIMHRGAEIPTV